MNLGNFLNQLNIVAQCKKSGLSIWQCPQFLFILMGFIIIASAWTTFAIANNYTDSPELAALIVLALSGVLIVISFMIIQGFEKLAEAYRMKSEFVSIVSHQLRSPVFNLQLVVDLLISGKAGKVDSKQSEYFKILKENSKRMQELISDLLIISRIESEKSFLQKEQFILQDLVKEIINETAIFAKSSNVEVIFESHNETIRIFADRPRVKITIENLLDNAIRYSGNKGKIKIIIKKNGVRAYCEISDSGVGIPGQDQKYIFQKFFRAKNILKYQTQGTGLGLYIARSIIDKSGGRISFKSQEGKGSTFWFTLPIFTK